MTSLNVDLGRDVQSQFLRAILSQLCIHPLISMFSVSLVNQAPVDVSSPLQVSFTSLECINPQVKSFESFPWLRKISEAESAWP